MKHTAAVEMPRQGDQQDYEFLKEKSRKNGQDARDAIGASPPSKNSRNMTTLLQQNQL